MGIINNTERKLLVIGVTQEVLNAIDTLGGKYNLNPILQKDERGKPIVQIRSLEKTCVHTPTQEDYDKLMQVLECGGIYWHGGALPTDTDAWDTYGENTIITRNDILCGDIRTYQTKKGHSREGYSILGTPRFYSQHNIIPEVRKEINNWFNKRKPRRVSKGKK